MRPAFDEMHYPTRRGFLQTAGVMAAAKPAKEPFRGVFTIPSTPFRPDGEIDILSFRRLIDFCIACGAHGLVFPVNASEWSVLSDEERINLTQVLVEQNAGRLPVVIGVNASAEENAARFAAHARTIGADAVIAMPPQSAQGDTSPALITSFYRKVSVAGRLPVFIQNHDAPVGTNMSADFVLRLCREIENVRYVKEESTPSTFKMTAILNGSKGVCQGVFGGSGGRYLIEEHRRGCAGQMPGSHAPTSSSLSGTLSKRVMRPGPCRFTRTWRPSSF